MKNLFLRHLFRMFVLLLGFWFISGPEVIMTMVADLTKELGNVAHQVEVANNQQKAQQPPRK